VTAVCAAAGLGSATQAAGPGTVRSVERLDRSLWIPQTTARAFVLEYATTNPFGERGSSTGTVFLPKGKAPSGGWPVISWAHGTSGLGDSCAPSRVGPALPARDWPYLANWMREGYAIVASDYVGLGTPGLQAYLHGRSTAHSVVDMVKAGRNFAREQLPKRQRLSRRWVVIGQSQGGGAAIYTARYATEFGGPGLDYRGAVGTGTPAYVEGVISLIGPGVPPVALTPGLSTYITYIFAALRYVHPELGIDGILTDAGRRYLKLAETECVFELEQELDGVNPADYFTRPVATLPNFAATVRDYMGMPEDGFDRPFFMGNGLLDLDVPFAIVAPYAAVLQLNGEPVTFRPYPYDHSGTLTNSQRDTIPFVRELLAQR
jgi:hypothetical protein